MKRAALLALLIGIAGCRHIPLHPSPGSSRVETGIVVLILVGDLVVHEVREHD
jgi:hypothetical protein